MENVWKPSKQVKGKLSVVTTDFSVAQFGDLWETSLATPYKIDKVNTDYQISCVSMVGSEGVATSQRLSLSPRSTSVVRGLFVS